MPEKNDLQLPEGTCRLQDALGRRISPLSCQRADLSLEGFGRFPDLFVLLLKSLGGLIEKPERDEKDKKAEKRLVLMHRWEVVFGVPRTKDGAKNRTQAQEKPKAENDPLLSPIGRYGDKRADDNQELIHGLDHVGIGNPKDRDMSYPCKNPPGCPYRGKNQSHEKSPEKRYEGIERYASHGKNHVFFS